MVQIFNKGRKVKPLANRDYKKLFQMDKKIIIDYNC